MNEIDMYAIGYLTSSVPAVHEGLPQTWLSFSFAYDDFVKLR